MGCRFSAGIGVWRKGDKSKVKFPGSYQHPGSCRARSLPRLILLASSWQLFQLFPSLLRPPNPPPPFTADDFTSHPTERTKPLVYTGSMWPMDLAVPLGLELGSAKLIVAGGKLTEPLSDSVFSHVKRVAVKMNLNYAGNLQVHKIIMTTIVGKNIMTTTTTITTIHSLPHLTIHPHQHFLVLFPASFQPFQRRRGPAYCPLKQKPSAPLLFQIAGIFPFPGFASIFHLGFKHAQVPLHSPEMFPFS